MEIKQISKEGAQDNIDTSYAKYAKGYLAIQNCTEGLEITLDNRQTAINFKYGVTQKIKRDKKFPNCKASVHKNVVTILMLNDE